MRRFVKISLVIIGVLLLLVAAGSQPVQAQSSGASAVGDGPSLIVALTPALLTVSGIALAWVLIKHRIKNI